MRNILYTLFIVLIFCVSCNDEEDLNTQLKDDRYVEMTKDNPDDANQHFIHEFYKNTGVVIVKNPEIDDYKYNFNIKNPIEIIPCEQDDETIKLGIDLIKETLLNFYINDKDEDSKNDYDFIKNNFPFTIQFAKEIKPLNSEVSSGLKTYCNQGLLVVSQITKDLKTLTDEEKREFQGVLNEALWQRFMINITSKFKPSMEFYDVCVKERGLIYAADLEDDMFTEDGWDIVPEGWKRLQEIGNERGFIRGMTSLDQIMAGTYPTEAQEVGDLLYGVFSYKHDDLMALCEKYPKIKEKYRILRNDIIEQFNIDISNINK